MASSEGIVAERRVSQRPPDSYQVLGERSSGTNFLNVVLKRNTTMAPVSIQDWKHGFPNVLAVPGNVLVLVSVRNALDWCLSMHAKPWHTTAELQALGFAGFLRAPWDTRVNRADYFGLKRGDPRVGSVLQQDRHPVGGAKFANPVHMRNTKLAAWLGLLAREFNVAIVRHEATAAAPKAVLAELAAVFGFGVRPDFTGVGRRLGSKFRSAVENRPPTPDRIGGTDRAFILDQLDLKQEARLGYHY